MPVDRGFTLTVLQELVRIDSRNPRFEAGAPGEGELAERVDSLLRELGWETEVQDLGDDRANVVACRPGTGGGPSLMINAHLDTVGVDGMEEPFGGEMRDGRIWGRGAQDIKGGVAAALGMAKALSDVEVELNGDVLLAFVADEEDRSLGTERLVQEVKTDAAIVLEPSDLDLCVAHRGFGVFRLTTRGRTAHGGRYDLGVDANLHMAHLLVELDRLQQAWLQDHRHEMLGAATLHVPLISGGRQLFIYAGECTSSLECRTVPGQSRRGVLGEMEATLESVGRRIDDFRGSVELLQWRQPWEIDPEASIVRTVRAATEEVRGAPPRLIGHPWWEDSALLGGAGIDAVVVGPVGHGMHAEEEWVDADSVVELAEILYRSALAFCETD